MGSMKEQLSFLGVYYFLIHIAGLSTLNTLLCATHRDISLVSENQDIHTSTALCKALTTSFACSSLSSRFVTSWYATILPPQTRPTRYFPSFVHIVRALKAPPTLDLQSPCTFRHDGPQVIVRLSSQTFIIGLPILFDDLLDFRVLYQ